MLFQKAAAAGCSKKTDSWRTGSIGARNCTREHHALYTRKGHLARGFITGSLASVAI